MEKVFLQKADPGFKDEIAEKIGLEVIKPCYSCASCTSVCPVHEVIADFDPRRIIHMIVLGMREEVLSSDLIWFCCLCNSCYLNRLEPVNAFLQDLCRRTMFAKVREGLRGPQTMPCWRKYTVKND